MKPITLSALLAAATIALSACGGEPPPPPHAKQGPDAEPASIALSTGDATGTNTQLQLNCGTGTPLEQCAEIARSLIDQASRAGQPGAGQPPAPRLDQPE